MSLSNALFHEQGTDVGYIHVVNNVEHIKQKVCIHNKMLKEGKGRVHGIPAFMLL